MVIKHSKYLEEFTYSMQCKCRSCDFHDWPLEIGLDGPKLKKLYLLNLCKSIIFYHCDALNDKTKETGEPFPELKEVYVKGIRLSTLPQVILGKKIQNAKILGVDNLEREFEDLPPAIEIMNNIDILFIRQLSSMDYNDLQKMFNYQKLLIENQIHYRVLTDMDIINAVLLFIQENYNPNLTLSIKRLPEKIIKLKEDKLHTVRDIYYIRILEEVNEDMKKTVWEAYCLFLPRNNRKPRNKQVIDLTDEKENIFIENEFIIFYKFIIYLKFY